MIITIINAIFIVAFLGVFLCLVLRYLKEKDKSDRLADWVHTLRVNDSVLVDGVHTAQYIEDSRLAQEEADCLAARDPRDVKREQAALVKAKAQKGFAKLGEAVRDARDIDGVFYDEWYGSCNTGPLLAEEKSYTEADKLKRAEKLEASKRLEAKILRKALKKAKDAEVLAKALKKAKDAAVLAKVPKKSSKRNSK